MAKTETSANKKNILIVLVEGDVMMNYDDDDNNQLIVMGVVGGSVENFVTSQIVLFASCDVVVGWRDVQEF